MNITFTELPKNQTLYFEYQFFKTPIGSLLVVSWKKNLVSIAFAAGQQKALTEAKKRFPKAYFQKKETSVQKLVSSYLKNPRSFKKTLTFTISGTPFQVSVWRALLRVPFGKTITYGELAKKLRKPLSTRAVASAVAKNPFAILLPCHRVVPKSGGIGKYRWGQKNKKSLLAWEQNSSKKLK